MFITYPYHVIDKVQEDNTKSAVGVCYLFNFTSNIEQIKGDIYKQTLNDEFLICSDVIIDSYIELFDNVQNQLYGYFFISITQKKYPMYYPGMLEDPYINDITRYEYNYTDYNFSILNVKEFNTKTLPKMIKEYNPETDIILQNNQNGKDLNIQKNQYYSIKINEDNNTYQKGNETFKYNIYPLFFDNYHSSNEGINNNKEHVLSVIYIMSQNNDYEQLTPYIVFLSILFCPTFFIIGWIIIICASYGIFVISNNITKPIKDIKTRIRAGLSKKNNIIKRIKDKNEFTYQGININKLISLGLINKKTNIINKRQDQYNNDQLNIEFDRNSNDIFGRHILGNENILKGNKNNEDISEEDNEEEKFLNSNNNNNNNEKEEDEEDDEGDETEYIPLVKNSEITNQFNSLLDLKKVMLFMRGPQVNFRSSNIIKFIECDKVFSKIEDKLGKNVSLSNIGNLENLKKRYDKSIIFLSKSLDLDNDKWYENKEMQDIHKRVGVLFEKDDKNKIRGLEEFNNKIRDNFTNLNTLNAKSTYKNDSTIVENKKEEIDSNINDIEFIRFMKLFYAYKMYFSNIKKIEKILNKTLDMTKTKNLGEENSEKTNLYTYIKSILFFFNDYLISNSDKIQKAYKLAIYTCLNRLVDSKDIMRKKEKIIYCYTELFFYYISELKRKIKKTINEINKNYNESNNLSASREHKDNDKLNQLKSDNEKCFKIIVDIANTLKEFIKKMNLKFEGKESNHISDGEINKYKDFLNELKTIEQKKNNIQFNIFLVEQRYNYYFAKFSKLCGDYAMAIHYYLKVTDENKLISNGILYMKANKKIVNIIKYAMNYPHLLSIHEKDEKIMKEILEKCSREIEMSKRKQYKDLIVILDKNNNNADPEKIYRLQIKQYKAITTIFDNFMSSNDRFAFYTFGNEMNNYENKEEETEEEHIKYIKNNSIKKLISLRFKNYKNYSFIKGIIDKFHDDIIKYYESQTKIRQMYLNLNKEEQNKSSFNIENSTLNLGYKKFSRSNDIYYMKIKLAINSVFKVIGDFNMHDEDRKKYIILISESFKNEQNNEINEDLFKDINDNYKIKIKKLFIIGTLLDEQNGFNLVCNELKKNGIRNEYLEFENIQEMNKEFLTLGQLPRQYEYKNEKLNE